MLRELSLQEAGQIYERDLVAHFPKEEVKPLENIARMHAQGCYRFYGLYEEEQLVAYAFLCNAPQEQHILLDYLAVLPEFRGTGYGKVMLAELGRKLDGFRTIMIETEDLKRAQNEDERRIRARRDHFYELAGARLTGVFGTVYEVPYAIWYLPVQGAENNEPTDVEYMECYDRIYRFMLSERGYREQFYVSCDRSAAPFPVLFSEAAEPSLVAKVRETVRNRTELAAPPAEGIYLRIDETGAALVDKDKVLQGDFTAMLPRLKHHNLSGELLVKAAKFRGEAGPFTAVDATAGLGEDAILLAAAGFEVYMLERDPVIGVLLYDALQRGLAVPELSDVLSRMHVQLGDSILLLPALFFAPDVVVLDPMFPERKKSGLIKKKFQLIQKVEDPCAEERELLEAAKACHPRRILVKRPQKGPQLAGATPSYVLSGKAIRYDCYVLRTC